MRLINQGMILGEGGVKMSKSMGNVINPDDIVREYGADTMRVYEMFMGPLEVSKPWSTRGIAGRPEIPGKDLARRRAAPQPTMRPRSRSCACCTRPSRR